MGTHDVQVDGSGLAWVAGGNGTAAYDVSNPLRPRLVKRTNRRGSRPPLNDLIHHNSQRLSRDVVAITEEAFGVGCRGAGTLQTWRISGGRRMTPLDSFGVERDRSSALLCSAHYFDARDGLIAQGFYEQGVRLIDARRPGRLRQVGYYVSRPGLFWGALFAPTDPAGSTVYALDHSRGIDILALDRTALRPVRRSGSGRPGEATDFGLIVDDGFDAVRPGQRLRLLLSAYGRGGPVDVQVTLPPELVDVRPPGGVDLRRRHADPARDVPPAPRRRRPDRAGARRPFGARGDAAGVDRLRQRRRRPVPARRPRRRPRGGRAKGEGDDVGGGRRCRSAVARVLRAPVGLHFVKSWRSNWGTGHAVVATATSCRRSGTRRWWSSSASRPSRA